ncbi:MFS general substrate transporter [Plenodomus tracheiphilus IPT5]|uniref:MFS general substrate transporter n=1 Tax=Plenodomus tracheiphilus IPT5 TaxID=1408161 RepID=A0A6A7AXN9_9PLEO|nr:MFS general substrate transporter [Plenodomus tracheiphilus IPT5]
MTNPGDTKDAIEHVENAAPAHNIEKPDLAAQFLANAHVEDASFTYEEERAVLRRIDLRVLPLLLGAYFFQQLDKSSLSYVSIFGFQTDAKLVGRQYSWLGSILYLAQLVMQPLAAFILVKFPTGKVIATAILLWGSSLAVMAACTNFPSLLGLRFVLGSFEAMIAPACVATTTMWWRRSEQTLRTAYWNAMNGVTFIVGSLFTYGLGHIHSESMYKYQIIFLFCGLLTVIYAFVVLFFMPDSPMKAKYLTERERIIAVERLRANQMGIQSGDWKWEQVWETLIDFKTWCWFIAIIAISIASGGISTFGNLIIRDFGYTNFQSILFNIPFGVIQVVAILGSSYGATKFKRKGLAITVVAILPIIGTVMMLTVPRRHKGVLLFGYYLVSCLAAITPIIYTWHVQNTAGNTKKKTTSAVVFIGMCTGNVIGPLLYSVDDAPLYRPGLISNLVMFILVAIIAMLIPMYLALLNKRHADRREQLGKSAVRIDESMLKRDEKVQGKDAELDSGEAGIGRQEQDLGFSDLTDIQNEDFIYVY